MTRSGKSVRSIFLHVTVGRDEIHLSSQKGLNRFLGLRVRQAEVKRRIADTVRHIDTIIYQKASDVLIFRRADIDFVRKLVTEIDDTLKAIACRPLTPRLVQEALGITARERLRWTKDGRLPTKGSISFRKGRTITIRTYPPEGISGLLSSPETIASWCASDASLA